MQRYRGQVHGLSLRPLRKKNLAHGPTHHKSNLDRDSHAGWESIREWLDGKGPSSTLYIAFGSESYLSGIGMRELAKGLEQTQVDFIWVARSPNGKTLVEDELPEGFIELLTRAGRGLILRDWAPQAEILAHPSVGGFMSHCGWGSVTESMYFGVPILGYPMQYEQPLNCKMVVAAGMAVEVVRGMNGELEGEKVASAIEKVIFGGGKLRVRARELSKKMRMEEEEEEEEEAIADELKKMIQKNKKSRAAVHGCD